MSVYRYKTVDGNGRRISGRMAAGSRQEIIRFLEEHELYPLKIQKLSDLQSLNPGNWRVFKRVTLEEISTFLRQLYTLFHAGITIPESLGTIAVQSSNRFFKSIMIKIQERLEEGKTLSHALSEYPRIFPVFLTAMVETGETAGLLEDVLLKMSVFYRKEHRAKTRIKNATFYPKFLAVLSLGLVIFMLVFVMPAFTGMFESAQVPIPGITKAVITISNFVISNFFLITLFCLALWALGRYFGQYDKVIDLVDRIRLVNPIVGDTVLKGMAGSFAGALSMLLGSGISMIQALEITARVMGNRHGEKAVLNLRDRVDAGISLSQAMNDAEFFPPILTAGVKTGEKSGALDDVLKQISGYYEEELEKSLDRTLRVLEPMMIVLMAVIIGFLVIAMILPLFDMVSALG